MDARVRLFSVMDFSWDKDKALRLWKERLKQVEQLGNFTTGGYGVPFFSKKIYTGRENKVYHEND